MHLAFVGGQPGVGSGGLPFCLLFWTICLILPVVFCADRHTAVDQPEARKAKSRIAVGVSDQRALWSSACAGMSILAATG
jgi:hypothetical protein